MKSSHYCSGKKFQNNKTMSRCQCLTREGKGSQCTREVPADERFCWQHQNCKTPIYVSENSPAIKSQTVKTGPTKKVPPRQKIERFQNYFDILPNDLIDELLFFLPIDFIGDIHTIFHNYSIKLWLIKKLMRITKLPREALIDVSNDPDLKHVMEYVDEINNEILRKPPNQVYWRFQSSHPYDFYKIIYEETVKFGYVSILKYIDNNNLFVYPHENLRNLLYNDIRDNRIATVKYLESIGAEIPDDFVKWQVGRRHYDLIKYLIDRGFPVDYQAFLWAIDTDSIEIIKLLAETLKVTSLDLLKNIHNTMPKSDIKKLVDFSFTLQSPENKSKADIIDEILRDRELKPKLFDYLLLSLDVVPQKTIDDIAMDAFNNKQYDRALYFRQHGAQLSDSDIKQIFANLNEQPDVNESVIKSFINNDVIDADEINSIILNAITKLKAKSQRTGLENKGLRMLGHIHSYIYEKNS